MDPEGIYMKKMFLKTEKERAYFFLVSKIMVWYEHEKSKSPFKKTCTTTCWRFVRYIVNVILRKPDEIYKHFKREHCKYKNQQWTNKTLIIMMANILYRSKRIAVNIPKAERSLYNYNSFTYLSFVWSCQQKINAYIHPNHNLSFIMWWHACQNHSFKPCLGRDAEEKMTWLNFYMT